MKKPTLRITPWLLLAAMITLAVQTADAGRLRRLIYSNYAGGTVDILYLTNMMGGVTFPDSPDTLDYIPNEAGGPSSISLPYIAESAINMYDNYGSLTRGYITVPETGDYVFYLTSDDEAQWWMNTDSADPLNPTKTNLVCHVPGWAGTRDWTKYPTQESAPVNLQAGKTYFMQIIHKDGTGGDHIVLGWKKPSGVVERPMPAWFFQPDRYVHPMFPEPNVEIVVGPVMPESAMDTGIYDGRQAVVYANINLAQPVTYQWYRNNVAVTGATNAYHIFKASVADNNTTWDCRVVSGGTTYQADAPGYLYVTPDTTAPEVASAGTETYNPTLVRVTFKEPLLASTATSLANYSIAGQTITSATLEQDGRTVLLKTGLLTADKAWSVTVSGVQDLANPPNTMVSATIPLVPADGVLSFRIWNSSFANSLATLRTWSGVSSTAPSYVNQQFDEERYITYTSQGWNLAPLRDNYMGQLVGYFTAPETGNYKFGIASDDHSILYLGTSDDPSTKREICYRDGSTGRWNLGVNASQRSAYIALEAGKRYYIEAVYRDGTGGDGVTVVVETPSQTASGLTLPTANSSTQSATEPFLIPPQYLSPYMELGPVRLASDLASAVDAAQSTSPVLSVQAAGYLPYSYTWYKDGTAIPGANAASYQLPYLTAADNGTKFHVVVNNNFSSVTSVVATINVMADVEKPAVASVSSLFKQTVQVRFSEPVAKASAETVANYALYNSAGAVVAVSSATVDAADPTLVTLQTAAMPETDMMELAVKNVADLSATAQVMDPSTNAFRAFNFDTLERINNNQEYSARVDGDRIIMTAGGADIWGTSDQMAYLYKTVTGNFDYMIQGLSLQTVNQWCKMGLMVRDTTAANSRNLFNAFAPPSPAQNTFTAQLREIDGASTTSSNDAGTPLNTGVTAGAAARPTVYYPNWIRIQRRANTFYLYHSRDGENWTWWTTYDSSLNPSGPFPNSVLLGIALTSHDTSRTTEGVVAGFQAIDQGALRLELQPTNTVALENEPVTFYAQAGGTTPYLYQWRTNGVDVLDATSANFTIPLVSCLQEGMQVSVRLTNPFGEQVVSTNATLSAIKDTVAPTFAYVSSPKLNLSATEVKLVFSERVNATQAQNPANYSIVTQPGGVPLAVSSALLDTDDRTVTLTTATQTLGTTYKVTVSAVGDWAGCPQNMIAPNSSDYFYYAGSAGNFVQRQDGFIIMEAESAQEINAASDGDNFELLSSEANYSGRGYMVVPNGRGGGSLTGTAPNRTGSGAEMVYYINFTEVGRHIVWIRGGVTDKANAGNDDSVFVGFNDTAGTADGANDWAVGMSTDDAQSSLSGFGAAGWTWRSDRQNGGDPFTFTNTTTGLHRFVLWHREDGTLIDKIVIERSDRAAANTAAPAVCTVNGGLGESESWAFLTQPPAAPSLVINNPTNGQTFASSGTVAVDATVTSSTPIASVTFSEGTNVLATVATAPYAFQWTSVPEGYHTLTVAATDTLGFSTSANVQIIADSSKPVSYAVGSHRGDSIGVYFADTTGLNAETATDPANYKVNGGAIAVTNVWLEPDGLAAMLAIASPVSGAFNVEIKNVADIAGNVMNTVTLQSTVQNLLMDRDIGTLGTNDPPTLVDPILPGLVQAIGTEGYYVRAGGSDIWNNADGMHFAYVPLTGNFDVSVRVASLLNADAWTKAGLMIREDLDADSRNYLIAAAPTTGQNLITMQWRAVKGGGSASLPDSQRPRPNQLPNSWLRVTRADQTFEFFHGTNGVDWTPMFSTNNAVAYPETVYVGLATTSHDNGTNAVNLTSAYYYNLTGLVSGPGLPVIKASVSGSNLVLTWSTADSAFKLQSTATLGTAWTDDSAVPVVSGDQRTVTVPIGTGSKFYRLMKP